MKRFHRKIVALVLCVMILMSQGITLLADDKGETDNTNQVDIKNLSASDWMKEIPDTAYLASMNIPGSHDSGLHNATAGFGSMAECQTLSIKEQLEAGVRFFDIRLRYPGDPDDIGTKDEKHELYVCHGQGFVCCDGYIVNKEGDKVNYTYNMVLDEMADFLEEHPSETIFYFTRNEYYQYDEKFKDPSTESYQNELCYRREMKREEAAIINRFKKGPKNPSTEEQLLHYEDIQNQDLYQKKMGESRGKIYHFPDEVGFGDFMDQGKFNEYDLSYNDKWARLKPFFDSAPKQSLDTKKTKKYRDDAEEKKAEPSEAFRAAWTSCTGQFTYNEYGEKVCNNLGIKFPFMDVLVPPTGGAEAKEMNKLLMNYKFDFGAYYGWIAMDMITEDLARLIFQTNDFNQIKEVISQKETTYIRDIRGFCDFKYDDALQACYEEGFTPLFVRTIKGRACYDINPDGYPIVLGYTTTTNPDEAITDIVGRFDSNVPGNYSKVIVRNSLYNYFTRGTSIFEGSEDTYLFVSRSKSHKPIREIEVKYKDKSLKVKDGMVSFDLDKDKPVGSQTVFNLQEGVDMDGQALFIGLRMIRDENARGYGTSFGTGNIIIIVSCLVVLVLAVFLMIEKKRNIDLKKKLCLATASLEKENSNSGVDTVETDEGNTVETPENESQET